jgi:threonine/homoserine/homoserine lactone efflux protein
MVGVCLTVLSLFRVLVHPGDVRTAGDSLLGLDALAFLLACFLAYVALRARARTTRHRMERWADGIFLLALALMGSVCLLLVYELSREVPRPLHG